MTTINLGRVVGEDGEDGRGIVSILKTGTSGLVDTYTITYTDGTTSTFEVTNGQSGGGGGGGISNVAKTMLLTILKKCYTSQDMSAEIDVLEDEFSKTGELTSISVTYSGGDVEVGTLTDTLPIVVTASYSDGTSSRVTTGYTLSPTEIEEGTNTITVTYSGKTATFTVTGVDITGELTSITAVCNDETATVGTSASELDITVTGHYSDGTSATLSGWTTSGTVQEGTNTFTITYETFTTTITVTGVAGEKTLTSIEVTSLADSAEIGTETANLKAITITANYSDNTTENIDISDCTVTPATIASGTNVLMFSYENRSTTLNLEGVDTTGYTVSKVTPTLTRTTYPTGTDLKYKIEGYYVVLYTNGVTVAGDLLECQGVAPQYASEGTNNYQIGLKGKYPRIDITGVNQQVSWLENVTNQTLYSYSTEAGTLNIANNVISLQGTMDRAVNISTANIVDRVNQINGTIPTYYTIPAGAEVTTTVKVTKVYSTLPRIVFSASKTGSTSSSQLIELINIYEQGVEGKTKTNTITVQDQTEINGIYLKCDTALSSDKELICELMSITVNGVEILGGVSNE